MGQGSFSHLLSLREVPNPHSRAQKYRVLCDSFTIGEVAR